MILQVPNIDVFGGLRCHADEEEKDRGWPTKHKQFSLPPAIMSFKQAFGFISAQVLIPSQWILILTLIPLE